MEPRIDRRAIVFGGTAAAAGGMVFVPLANAETQEHYGPTRLIARADLLPLARAMKYGRNGTLALWWKSLTTFGVVEGKERPYYKQDWAVIQAATDLDNGGFQGKPWRLSSTAMSRPGKVIDQFVNPYTGETIDIPWGINGPSTTDYTAEETIMPGALPGATFEHDIELGPATAVNDEIWLPENFTTVASFDNPAIPPFMINERSTLMSRLDVIMDASAEFVPTPSPLSR